MNIKNQRNTIIKKTYNKNLVLEKDKKEDIFCSEKRNKQGN